MRLLTDMPRGLLREYIDLMVEKIRTKKGDKGRFGDKFNLNRFKQLASGETMLTYANFFLEELGEGSSRKAFLLSGKYVLKIATNNKGLGQNEAEVDVYTNPKSKPVVAKIYASDPEYRWLIADVVKPIKSREEFQQLSGMDWMEFSSIVTKGIKGKQMADDAPEFAKRVLSTALDNNLLRGDLSDLPTDKETSIDHYGKTPDGRIVLLDYGYTEGVWSTYYSKPKPTAPEKGDDASKTVTGDYARREKEKEKIDAYGKTSHVGDVDPTAKTQPAGDRAPQSRTKPAPYDAKDTKTIGPRPKTADDDPKNAKTNLPPAKRRA